MRAALDHLACCEALRQGRSTCNGVYFPIAPSKAEYPDLAKDKLRKCSDAFKDFVEALQPYRGGNDGASSSTISTLPTSIGPSHQWPSASQASHSARTRERSETGNSLSPISP